MSGLDLFAAFVLLVLFVVAIAIWVALAMLPGAIAKSRNHPQADAINVGGWLGALFLFVLWPLMLIWAFTKPQAPSEFSGSQSKMEVPMTSSSVTQS